MEVYTSHDNPSEQSDSWEHLTGLTRRCTRVRWKFWMQRGVGCDWIDAGSESNGYRVTEYPKYGAAPCMQYADAGGSTIGVFGPLLNYRTIFIKSRLHTCTPLTQNTSSLQTIYL